MSNDKITADMARALTKVANDETLATYKAKYDKAIREAATKGKYSVCIKDSTREERKVVQPYYQALGFAVKYSTGVQWDPCNNLTISW